jgi:hypothetical protein
MEKTNLGIRSVLILSSIALATCVSPKILDADGNRIASFEGGRSHTGMEFGEGFAGKDQIQAIAVTKSVKQIQDFVENDSAIPSS